MNFSLLGDFLIEKDKKYFQVYFRKDSEYKELTDFLIYDISKIKEAEENEYNLKSKFFAKVADHFKTPINSILVLIQKMKEKMINEKTFKKHDYYREIKFTLKQIENLSNYVILMINDIIQYSNFYSISQRGIFKSNNDFAKVKINSDMNTEEINLMEITKFCKEVLQTLLRTKEKERYISIKYDFDEEINNYNLISDEFHLKQMLLNLLSNSINFTKSGSIAIRSELVKGDKNFIPYVKISIIDTGIGMEEKELRSLKKFKEMNLFECGTNYFYQEGCGIGIFIIKYLADQLNHRFEIESCYQKGSCFSILINAQAKESENQLKNKIYPSDSVSESGERNKNSLNASGSNPENYSDKYIKQIDESEISEGFKANNSPVRKRKEKILKILDNQSVEIFNLISANKLKKIKKKLYKEEEILNSPTIKIKNFSCIDFLPKEDLDYSTEKYSGYFENPYDNKNLFLEINSKINSMSIRSESDNNVEFKNSSSLLNDAFE